MKAHGFPHAALDSIPQDGLADCSWNRKSGPRALRQRLLCGRSQAKGGEERAGIPGALVIDFAEIAAAEDSAGFRKTESVPCDRNG